MSVFVLQECTFPPKKSDEQVVLLSAPTASNLAICEPPSELEVAEHEDLLPKKGMHAKVKYVEDGETIWFVRFSGGPSER